MNDRSETCNREISRATPNVTSSPGSADGPSLSEWPDGQTRDLFGQDHARANPSAPQERKPGSTTNGTCGRSFTGSSMPVGLQSFLENRLRARMALRGGTLYKTTWKVRITPRGRRISALRASAPRISASDCSGWPTPPASNAEGSQMAKDASPTGRRPDGSKATVSLNQVVQLAGWPTARQADGSKNVRTAAGALSEIARKGSPQDLAQAAAICGPTRLTASGETLTGCCVAMENGGRLSPEHSRWILGYPVVWGNCAVTGTLSRRKSRRNSSGHL